MVRVDMKILKYVLLIVFITVFVTNAQELEVITHGMTKYEPLGTFEIIIDFEVVNVSPDTQIVFEIRTINNLPAGWTSSLCFGTLCFDPETDTIITAPPFPEPPVPPGDTVITSIHVYTDLTSIGTAYIQLEVGTLSNPGNKIILNFTATTDPTVSVEDESMPGNYFLEQNFPNPFNPSTQISYGVKEGGFVSLKVYNILGSEIATLVNNFKSAGNYIVDFKGGDLASGIYIYRLSVNNFIQTRKMILEK